LGLDNHCYFKECSPQLDWVPVFATICAFCDGKSCPVRFLLLHKWITFKL